MRSYEKRILLNIIKGLENKNDVLKKVEDKEIINQEIIENLQECQESAIIIGNKIDELEGEGTKAVALLEKYCENLYQLCESFNDTKNRKSLISKNQTVLSQVVNCIRYEFETKKLVAFLPYKASMWDSLESIWQAADEDKNCEALVIPIPYFDKNSDGTFGKMHYEGREYPSNVAIVDWKNVDLERLHPDIIYFHNPYDQHNYITSVHPNFYSQQLKKCTDMLVYVPYFICLNNVPTHFCILNGVFAADKVIVQSERVRQTYINEYIKAIYEQLNKENTKYKRIIQRAAEEKFLSIGSPKLDKVREMMQRGYEEIQMPEAWKKLIYQNMNDQESMNQRKKIVLYNTSIQALLNHKKLAIEKIKDVLRAFKENKDVLLWWRPHPLSDVTLQAMIPDIFNEYQQIVVQYQQEGWGIFDDTIDVHRSIRASDAYYGDGSSLVSLYQITGKPIMQQRINLVNSKENLLKHMSFEAFTFYENKGWICANEFNAIFELDLNDNSIRYLRSFPGYRIGVKRLYSAVVYQNNKLYFAPMSAKSIAIYDLITNEITYIDLLVPKSHNNMIYEPKYKFYNLVLFQEALYFIGFSYPAIIRMDMKTHKLEYYDKWIEETKDKVILYKNNFYFSRSYQVIENFLYLPCANTGSIIKINLIDMTYDIYDITGTKDAFSGICYDGKQFWIAGRFYGEIYSWNEGENIIEKFENPYVSERHVWSYIDSFCEGDHVYFFPDQEKCIIKINIKTKKISMDSDVDNRKEEIGIKKDPWLRYGLFEYINDKVFVLSNVDKVLMIRDKIMHKTIKYAILDDQWNIDRFEMRSKLSDKIINLKLAAEKVNKNDITLNKKQTTVMNENPVINLQVYLTYIEQQKDFIKEKDFMIGKKIHDYICKIDN